MKPVVVRMCIMPPTVVLYLTVGSLTLAGALLVWWRGRIERSRAKRWLSVAIMALSLSAWFSAVAILVGPGPVGLWYALGAGAALLAMGILIIGILSMDREERATRQR
jgi:peptidoglycan/LPS O-acetylase OafA/YrhL